MANTYIKAKTTAGKKFTFDINTLKWYTEADGDTTLIALDYQYYDYQEKLELKKTDEPMKVNIDLPISTFETILTNLGNTIFNADILENLRSIYFSGAAEKTLYLGSPVGALLYTGEIFMLNMWFKPDSPSADGRLFANNRQVGSPPYNGLRAEYIIDAGSIYPKFIVTGNNEGVQTGINVIGGDAIPDGVWSMLTFVWDGGDTQASIKIYINGVEASSYSDDGFSDTNVVGTITEPVLQACVGSYNKSPSFTTPVKGWIDEVSLHNYGGTEEQILSIYNGGIPVNLLEHSTAPYLKNWWRMGDGDIFPNIIDQTGDSDAVMINMTSDQITTETP